MTDASSQPSRIDQIAADFWERPSDCRRRRRRCTATTRYDDRLDDPGPEGRAEVRALAGRVAAEAAAVDEDGLPVEDRITRDMLRVVAELTIESDDLCFHELTAVDQINGPQTLLAQIAQFQAADTPERLDAWLSRLRAYGPHIDAYVEILAEGRRSGRTAARIVTERTIDQLGRLLAVPIEEAMIPAMSRVASDADRERVRDVVREVVYPADRRYLEALSGRVPGRLPRATGPGVGTRR